MQSTVINGVKQLDDAKKTVVEWYKQHNDKNEWTGLDKSESLWLNANYGDIILKSIRGSFIQNNYFSDNTLL